MLEIGALTTLTRLRLAYCTFTPLAYQHIAKLAKLEELDVSWSVTSQGPALPSELTQLTALHHLRDLNLSNKAPVYISDLIGLSAISTLTALRLRRSGTFDQYAAETLRQLPELRLLDLTHCGIGNPQLKHLAEATQLHVLLLKRNAFDNRGLAVLNTLRALTYLDLSFCPSVNYDVLPEVLDGLLHLQPFEPWPPDGEVEPDDRGTFWRGLRMMPVIDHSEGRAPGYGAECAAQLPLERSIIQDNRRLAAPERRDAEPSRKAARTLDAAPAEALARPELPAQVPPALQQAHPHGAARASEAAIAPAAGAHAAPAHQRDIGLLALTDGPPAATAQDARDWYAQEAQHWNGNASERDAAAAFGATQPPLAAPLMSEHAQLALEAAARAQQWHDIAASLEHAGALQALQRPLLADARTAAPAGVHAGAAQAVLAPDAPSAGMHARARACVDREGATAQRGGDTAAQQQAPPPPSALEQGAVHAAPAPAVPLASAYAGHDGSEHVAAVPQSQQRRELRALQPVAAELAVASEQPVQRPRKSDARHSTQAQAQTVFTAPAAGPSPATDPRAALSTPLSEALRVSSREECREPSMHGQGVPAGVEQVASMRPTLPRERGGSAMPSAPAGRAGSDIIGARRPYTDAFNAVSQSDGQSDRKRPRSMANQADVPDKLVDLLRGAPAPNDAK